jgi:hypothetical protein
VSLRKRLRSVFVCTFLQFGALVGVPMIPRDIEELMQQMNAAKLAHTLPSEEDDGGGPPDERGTIDDPGRDPADAGQSPAACTRKSPDFAP